MLNLTAVVLRLARPFVSGYLTQNPKFSDLFERHLQPSYYTTHARRLGSAPSESTLAGRRGGGGGASSSSVSSQVVADDPALAAGAASFVAEVFFLSQRYMHVGLLPAVHRCVHTYATLCSSCQMMSAAAVTDSDPIPLPSHLTQDSH